MNKTTILPDNPNQAALEFNELLGQDKILFVVLGDSAGAASLAQKADNLAGDPGEPRWVIWAKTPEHIAESISELESTVQAPQTSPPDFGFTVSFANKICDVIRANEPEPDNVRVFEAFNNASL